MSSPFLTLNNINCNGHTEKKNGLTYLSWAWAWTELKKLYPESFYTVYEDERLGHTVVIRHQDGYVTCYASLSEDVAVAPGDKVTLGQKIGTVGSSALLESALGDHIHFSVTHNDEPMDPQKFLELE